MEAMTVARTACPNCGHRIDLKQQIKTGDFEETDFEDHLPAAEEGEKMEATTVSRAACPECGRKIALEPHVKKGDWITCPHCKAADIEVISLNPPLLDWAYEGPELAGSPWPWRGGPGWRR